MSRDGQHRHPVALAVKQAVDEMQVPRTARPRADSKLAGDMGLRSGGKRCHLLVPRPHPTDFLLPMKAVAQSVEGVARDAPDALDTSLCQGPRDVIGNAFAHC